MGASSPQDQILGIRPSCSMACVRTCLAVVIVLTLGSSQLAFAQQVSATLGVTRTMKSTILGEDRKVFVDLPTGYRDMMPVVARDYPGPPRAEAFLGFLEKELIPEIEKTYRTLQPRILLGKSLSGLFTLYSLLARPMAFDANVGCSAGWFAENNEYFLELSTRALRTMESFANRRVYMANSLNDQYDPDQAIHRQMLGLSELIRRNAGETFSYRYQTYENYPHVPLPCLYDGLRFVTVAPPKK